MQHLRRCKGICGENNWHGTAQTHPRDIASGLERKFAERQQAEKHRHRTRHENHEHTKRQTRQHHMGLHKFTRVHKQTEREEHDDLHQPGEAAEESGDSAFQGKFTVPHIEAGDVDGQITVSSGEFSK